MIAYSNYCKSNKFLKLFIACVAILFLSGCQTKQTTKVQHEEKIEKEEKPIYNQVPEDQILDKPQGVIAFPDTIEYIMPDGYELLIFLKGDEYYHTAQTIDGFYLLFNDDGFYEYAINNKNGDLVASGIIARNPEDRTEDEILFLKKLQQ